MPKSAKTNRRRKLFQTAAFSALLTAFMTLSARADTAQEDGIVIEASDWESSRLAGDPHVMSAPQRKLAASAALAALAASMVAVIGPNRVLRWIVEMGRFILQSLAWVLSKPLKAASRAGKVVARVAKDAVKGPGKFILLMGGLLIFALTGVAVLDHQWTVGILVGLVGGYLTASGVEKAKKSASSLWRKMTGNAEQAQTTSP